MNGDQVIAYVVEIQTSDPLIFSTETVNCDGSEQTILTNKECKIPFSTLRTTPFKLPLGTLI